jgi:hypothetical protein
MNGQKPKMKTKSNEGKQHITDFSRTSAKCPSSTSSRTKRIPSPRENGKRIRSEKLITETDIPDFVVRHQNLNLAFPIGMWMLILNLFEAFGKSSLPRQIIIRAPDIWKTNDKIVIPRWTLESEALSGRDMTYHFSKAFPAMSGSDVAASYYSGLLRRAGQRA